MKLKKGNLVYPVVRYDKAEGTIVVTDPHTKEDVVLPVVKDILKTTGYKLVR